MNNEGRKDLVSILIVFLLSSSDRKLAKRAGQIAKRHPILRAKLDARARNLARQRRYERQSRTRREQEEREKARQIAEAPVPSQEVKKAILESERGNVDAWWKIDFWLHKADNHTGVSEYNGADLEATPGWLAADLSLRQQILDAARRFLLQGDPLSDDWSTFTETSWHRIPISAYRALLLLGRRDPLFLNRLGAEHWHRWIPALLYAWDRQLSTDPNEKRDLLHTGYRHAGGDMLVALRRILDRRIEKGEWLGIIRDLEPFPDDRIPEILWSYFGGEFPLSEANRTLLGSLLRRYHPPALEFARTSLLQAVPQAPSSREAALTVALLFIGEAPDAAWDVVWKLCTEDPDFGKELWLRIADRSAYEGAGILLKLPLSSTRDLFLWLFQQFPPEEDPKREGAFTPTPRDELAFLRGRILRFLVDQGSAEACRVLEEIRQALPNVDWIQHAVLDARQNLLRKTFPWPKPGEVLDFTSYERVRLVRTEAELLDLLLESLKRLQEKLWRKPVIFLWNQLDEKLFRPKEENDFSDYIEDFLNQDLRETHVVANREVEIWRKRGGGAPGERTDIYVTVKVPESGASLTVVIEVKGCWNKALMKSMRAQLVERYLKNNRLKYGIYLTGWFNCSQWDASDSRFEVAKNLDRAELERVLDEQARTLSETEPVQVKSFILDASLR